MPFRFTGLQSLCTVAACITSATTYAAPQPAQVPEAVAHVLRTGLDLPDRIATTYAWLDDHHLAVTATEPGDDATYSGLRRLVMVNTRTGVQKTLLARGFLTCANAHTGVVAAYVGDLRKLLRDGDAPAPVLTWFRWNSKREQLEEAPLAKGQAMHSQQCRIYEPEQDLNGQVMTGVATVRYLEPGHGQLRWQRDYATQKLTDVRWERGESRRGVDMRADVIPPFVPWLPYRSAYLLSPGWYNEIQGQWQEVMPVTTIDLQGRVSRSSALADLKQALKQMPIKVAMAQPIRDGLLVMVEGRSDEGAGLYRHSRQGLQRLFCARPPSRSRDVEGSADRCFEDLPQISSDGCSAAFVTRYDFEDKFPLMGMQGQVHVLNLCGKPGR